VDFKQFLNFDRAEMIAPIGVSFGIKNRPPDFFFLEIIGDKDSPIRFNGRIVTFDDEKLCRSALSMIGELLPEKVKAEHKYDFICDIPRAMTLITEQEIDSGATVLNCLNTLLDVIATGPFDLPDEYRVLRSLADRLTFKEEFGEFKQIESLLRNALLWCAGATVSDLTLIYSLSEFEPLLSNLSATINKD